MGVDFIDLPELHRRKVIKLPEEKLGEAAKITNDGYFDLSPNTQTPSAIETPVVKEEASQQVTSFLSDFASIGAAIPQATPQEDNASLKDLKWRLENLEFKLEQLIERVNAINS